MQSENLARTISLRSRLNLKVKVNYQRSSNHIPFKKRVTSGLVVRYRYHSWYGRIIPVDGETESRCTTSTQKSGQYFPQKNECCRLGAVI